MLSQKTILKTIELTIYVLFRYESNSNNKEMFKNINKFLVLKNCNFVINKSNKSEVLNRNKSNCACLCCNNKNNKFNVINNFVVFFLDLKNYFC